MIGYLVSKGLRKKGVLGKGESMVDGLSRAMSKKGKLGKVGSGVLSGYKNAGIIGSILGGISKGKTF